MTIRIEADTLAELVALARQLTGTGEITINGDVTLTGHTNVKSVHEWKGVTGKTTGPADGKPSAAVIHPDDNPETGMPEASEVFGKTDDTPSAASVFGQAGNAPAGALSIAAAGTPTNVPAAPTGISTQPTVIPPPPPPNVAPAGTLLDKDGLPWNATIHASTRTQTADGRWKMKRGVEADVVARVTAEMRAVMAGAPAAPAVAVIPPPPPPPAMSIAPTAVTPGDGVTASATPPAPEMTWPLLCQRITTDMSAGTLTTERLKEVLEAQGLLSFPLLVTFPDRIPAVAKALGYTE
jgi:hypothetical protein